MSIRELQKELTRVRIENDRMKSVLITYYRAEVEYMLLTSNASYGKYREASEKLVKLAESLAKQAAKQPSRRTKVKV